jgi:excisionase family DNA binding protein
MTNDETNYSQPDPLTIGELISLQEAAAYCGLSKHSLLTYARNGRLRAKKIGSQWTTTRTAVDEYMRSRDLESIPKKHRKSLDGI